MRITDRQIREALKNQPGEMPDDISHRFDDSIERLKKQTENKKVKRLPFLRPVALTAAMLAVVFVAVINISKNAAYAVQGIPIIGRLMSVITVHKLSDSGEFYSLDAKTPQIEDQSGLTGEIGTINDDVKGLTDAAIAEFYKSIEDYPESYQSLDINYKVVTNTDKWFTLRIDFNSISASSNTSYRFYHIDKEKGKIVKLSDLFSEDFDYVSVFSEEIISQAKERMAQNKNGDTVYFIDTEFKHIKPDENFYLNDDGNIVIVFEKYEITPGFMGNPEFEISKELYEDYLK